MSVADVTLESLIRTGAHGRSTTPREREILDRIRPPKDYPIKRPSVAQTDDGSEAMLPVARHRPVSSAR
jgi:plasmid stability protein